MDSSDQFLQDFSFITQGGALRPGEGGGNPILEELAQTEHFTQQYMYDFIDYAANRGEYYTVFDFFPDGVPW